MPRKREVKPSDVVRVFLERDDQFEPLTAREVADELDVSRRTAYVRLEELADRGAIRTKKTGAKGRVWWPDADVWYPDVSQIGLANRSVEQVLERVEESTVIAEDADLPPVVEREIEAIDLPGEGQVLERRREAIRQAYAQLAQLGEADRQDILGGITFDPADLGYRGMDSFWSNLVVKHDVFNQLSGVVSPPEGGRYYRYVSVEVDS